MSSAVNEALSDAVAEVLGHLLQTLDALDQAQRRLHPASIGQLVEQLQPLVAPLGSARQRLAALDRPEHLVEDLGRLESAAEITSRCLDGVTGAVTEPWMAGLDPSMLMPAYRALRRRVEALETLYPLSSVLVPVSRFFLEESRRGSPELVEKLARSAGPAEGSPPVGLVDGKNDRGQRGGFTVYVPEYWSADRSWPLVVALHGGSGHGADFVWSWLREARSRGFVVLSPTSRGRTWSLMRPSRDAEPLRERVDQVLETWNLDRSRVLLTGMSDGGTFTLLSGFRESAPYTHLAPISSVLAPLPRGDRERAPGRPVYLVHGALDWMFPVDSARMASRSLTEMGADVVYREIADLSHTYPREENERIIEWLDGNLSDPACA